MERSLADLAREYNEGADAAQAKFNQFLSSAAGGIRHFFATPGDVAAGKYTVTPEVPGQWSEADEFRQQQADNRLTDWGASTALGMIGGARLPGGAPAGALGSSGSKLTHSAGSGERAPKASALPTDEVLRMARARNLGFYTDMPLYHGTNGDFRSFDPGRAAHTSGAISAREGVWSALEPEVADEFARMAASRGFGSPGNPSAAGPSVMPLLHRSESPAALTLRGGEKDHEIAATLAQAWDDGFTSVLLRNYTTPSGATGKNILVVKEPAQLRSRFAAFDPSKFNLSDLLAGGAGAAVLAAINASDADAAPLSLRDLAAKYAQGSSAAP